jgi:homoserine kinase
VAVAAAAAAGSEDPLAAGVEVDGHGENAAASLLGGLVAAADVNGAVEVVSLSLDPELRCVVVIPDVELATATAREVVPTTVARADAVFNLQRQARLVAGLGNLELLASFATEDRLHQPFRSALLPWSSSLLTSMVEAGALASAWSGAGSTMIAFLRENEVAAVLDAARSHMAEHSEPADVRAVAVDRSGLTVL